MAEVPQRPYLLRALFEWCVDNGYTPYIAVKVDSKTQVPAEYVKDGEILLNISPNAVHKLQMGNDMIEFSARFGGVPRQISLPVANIFACYAKETRQGMAFDGDSWKPIVQMKSESEAVPTTAKPPTALPAPAPDPKKPSGGGKPTLRRIK
jgi:stringent starvation protein B